MRQRVKRAGQSGGSGWVWLGIFGGVVSGAACAADFRVGAGGDYVLVSQALAAALAAPSGSHRVMLRAGTHTDNISFTVSGGRQIALSGGWNDDFSAQTRAPAMTVLQSGVAMPVVRSWVQDSAVLTLDNLTVTGAQGSIGGAIRADVSVSGQLVLRDLTLSGNQSASAYAAGLNANLSDSAALDADGVIVRDNVSVGTGIKSGTGIRLACGGASVAWLRRVQIFGNADTVSATGAYGLGMEATLNQSAALFVEDSVIHDQTAQAGSASNVGVAISQFGTTSVLIDRVALHRNNAPSATAGYRDQLGATVQDGAALRIENTLVAQGARNAVSINGSTTGSVRLTNLTLADHGGRGIDFNATGSGIRRFTNSIVHGFGVAFPNWFSAGTDHHHNTGSGIDGIDPRFVGGGDYRLQSSSPAIDAGDDAMMSVAPGLDLDATSRFQGARIDIGAYEQRPDAVFGDGFDGVSP